MAGMARCVFVRREANAIEIRSLFVEVVVGRSVRLGLLSICVGITFAVVDMLHYLFAASICGFIV